MENNNYSSLTDRLIQNGIISSSGIEPANFFEKPEGLVSDDENSNIVIESQQQNINNNPYASGRINGYDLNLIRKDTKNKNLKPRKKIGFFDSFLLKFFPKLYRAKLVKKAMKKFSDLNIDAALLFNKTIPYGESEIRYGDLIKYLTYANELQIELSDD